jgi:hypothetical protein
MKQKLYLLCLILFPCISWANLDLITWKGTYYQAKPIKKGITLAYCKEHTIGNFIHTIKDSNIKTDKNILLTDSHFNIDKVNNIYLIHGDFLATSKANKSAWQDRIYYFLYKFSENGITKGIWYTDKCKGLYKGIAIKDANK